MRGSRRARIALAPGDLSWALRAGVDGISAEHFLLTERLVWVPHKAGLSVNTGIVNRPELLSRVLEFAPDAIGTDRPHELRAGAETASARRRSVVAEAEAATPADPRKLRCV